MTAGIIFGACAGAGVYLLQSTFGGSTPAAVDSWLGEKTPQKTVRATTTTRATLPAPRTRGVRKMPDFTFTTVDGEDVQLYRDGVAPAVVTEFLIGCGDCQTKFEYFPKLVPPIEAAGEEVVNVAYMGRAHSIRNYFEGRNFGGPVHIDKASAMQRHFGIGTFTVWLLDRHGTILFQGPPQQAEAQLERTFALRAEQQR
jgi:hypothetical protein